MEIYILDRLLRRSAVVDQFESLIWTERFSEIGDFELVINSTPASRGQFVTGVMVAINNSTRVMTVETVENKVDAQGKATLKVKGRSLEAILQDRVAAPGLENLADTPSWNVLGRAPTIARYMFDEICVKGRLSPSDVIPYMSSGNMYPEDTIPEPEEMLLWEQEPDTLFNVIKKLCDLYDLGFRITRDFDTSKLYFNVYTGNDRTTEQSVLPVVRFSPDLENLQNTTELSTIEKSKNIAYVYSNQQGAQVVIPENFDPDTNGFERRVIFVKADDLKGEDENTPPPPEEITAHLIQKGRDALFLNRAWFAFDGELDQNTSYRYGVDYNLGDLVEMRNVDGVTNSMRVTEQIFVHDQAGERSYPTLSINKFIAAGWWDSWKYNRFWVDFGLTEYWVDQP